jgi:hypothetical protein
MPTIPIVPLSERTPTAAFSGDYHHDVFICHCKADEIWVEEELVSSLERAGLQVKHELPLGVDTVVAIGEAINRSRRTVIVLTDDFHQSVEVDCGTSVAGFLDPGGLGRVIPLLLRTCRVPEVLARRSVSDFTDPARHAKEMVRLLENLGRSEEVINNVIAESKKGFEALHQLMQTPEVRAKVIVHRETFKKTSKQIGMLRELKDLHDAFQVAEDCYNLVLDKKKTLGTAEEGWEEIETPARKLEARINGILDLVRSESLAKRQFVWAKKLQVNREELLQAVESQNLAQLTRALARIYADISKVPGNLNVEICTLAGQIELDDVVIKLGGIHDNLTTYRFEEEADCYLQQLHKGIAAIADLGERLHTHVTNHDCLQQVDGLIRQFPPDAPPSAVDVAEAWEYLQAGTKGVSANDGEDWVVKLHDKSERLDQAVKRFADAADRPAPLLEKDVRSCFRAYRASLWESFNANDQNLLHFCKKLEQVGETLKGTLEDIAND